MAIGTDFSVNPATGAIRHIANTDKYTVLELHRWLQDLADQQQASGDDLIDITTITPSARATDNIITLNTPFNIDDTAAQYLYNGSIEQVSATGAEMYSGLVVVGSVYGTTTLQVVQNHGLYNTDSPFWGTGINVDAANNILSRMLIKTRSGGVDIDQKKIRVYAREWGHTYAEFEVTMGLGNSVAAIFTSQDLNNQTVVGTVATWTEISNTEGYQTIDLQNGDGAQPYYSQWNKASYSINQLYERAKWLSRRGTASTLHGMDGELFRGPTLQFAYQTEANGPFVLNEVLSWGCAFTYGSEVGGPFTVGEKLTFGTSGAIGVLVALKDDGATGKMVVNVQSGTPANTNTITGGTSSATAAVSSVPTNTGVNGAGRGVIVALNDTGTTGSIWIQQISGAAPVASMPIRGGTSDATAAINGAPTARSLSPVFIGQSTGSAIIGAYGIGIEAADLTTNDKVFDLANTLRTPPNNVVFTVYGLVNGEDRVLVTNAGTGVNVDYDQLALGTTLVSGTATQVDVGIGNIPADTPQTGTLRIELDTGIYRFQAYNSHDNSRYFTITSADYSGTLTATAANDVFLAYIDKLAGASSEQVTFKYSAPRTLFVRVRDGGTAGDVKPIKTFETTAGLSSGGGSATAIRTDDA